MVDQPPVMMVSAAGLAEDLGRLAAAAGCELDALGDVGALRHRWSAAPLVLLDGGAAAQCGQAGLARRDRVIVVTQQGDPSVWQRAVEVGAEHVVTLPDAESWLVGALADAVEASGVPGQTLAVLGGRGGAGASVLAAAVAARAADRDRGVLLVDCDALGGGLDLLFGMEDAEGLRWSDLTLNAGRVAASSLHAALVQPRGTATPGRLAILSCGRHGSESDESDESNESDGPDGSDEPDATAVRAVCAAGRRAGDLVVCDLPRHACEPAEVAVRAADLVVLVVPAEVRGCAAAAPVAARVSRLGVTPQLVVRGPAPGGLTPGDVAQALGLPLLSGMRPQPGLAGALDRGQPPGRGRGPLSTTAAEVLDALDGPAGGARGRAA